MESQSRVSIKGINGLLAVNVFIVHMILGKSMVKIEKPALVQASHTTRAYPDLLCQIIHVVQVDTGYVNNGVVLVPIALFSILSNILDLEWCLLNK